MAPSTRGLSFSALTCLLVVLGSVFGWCHLAMAAAKFDEISVERYAKLRETEKYQLDIAEKYYREKKWKVAAAEYEKFITLYERSDGASYAQFKWSLCQREMRKMNTAISEGFRSVIDYWPDSPEAMKSAYLIAETYENMGDIRKAKRAYAKVISDYEDHNVALFSKRKLLERAKFEEDEDLQLDLLRELTFETKRETDEANSICSHYSRELASHLFYRGEFSEGLKSLDTTYDGGRLCYELFRHVKSPIWSLSDPNKEPEIQEKAVQLADQSVGYLMEQRPLEWENDEQKSQARTYFSWAADLHKASRRPEKVAEVYDEMFKIFGTDDASLKELADWYKDQKKYDLARETYAKLENKTEGILLTAEVFLIQEQYPLARMMYTKLPEPIEGQRRIADVFKREGKPDEAINIWRQLLQRDPSRANEYFWNIAHTLRETGKYKEAILSYRQIAEDINPKKYMASCHRALKQWDEAIGLYRQLMIYEREAPGAMLEIARTQEQAERKESAIVTYQQVCKKFPKSGEASTAHAHLQNKYEISVTLGGATDDN